MSFLALALFALSIQDPAPGSHTLRGRIQYAGTEVVSGELRVYVWQGDQRTPESAVVRGGEWSLDVPPDARVQMRRFVPELTRSRGPDLFPLDPDRRWSLPADGVLVTRFGRPLPFELDLVDARTEAKLERFYVEAYYRDELPPNQLLPSLNSDTGKARLRLERGGKGYRVEGSRIVTLFAWAPGYATGQFDLDPMAGGHYGMALEPAGRLSVQIEGSRPWRFDPLVRVWDAQGSLVFEMGLTGRIVLDHLPLGRYRISVEGERRENPWRFGELSLSLLPGVVERGTLYLHEGRIRPVPIAGTLAIPYAWDSDAWRFHLKTTTRHTEREVELRVTDLPRDAQGRPRFGVYDAVPGIWLAFIPEISWMAVLDVGPEGSPELALHVPPPQTLRVHVIEDGSGERAEIRTLRWQWERPPDDRGSPRWDRRSRYVTTDAEGLAVIQVPQGIVVLEPWSWLHEDLERRLVAGSEPREVILEMVPLSGIRFRWTGLGTWPLSSLRSRVTFVLEDGTQVFAKKTINHRDGLTIGLEPGHYWVSFLQPPGCKAIQPFTVEVRARELIPVEVDLVPIQGDQ